MGKLSEEKIDIETLSDDFVRKIYHIYKDKYDSISFSAKYSKNNNDSFCDADCKYSFNDVLSIEYTDSRLPFPFINTLQMENMYDGITGDKSTGKIYINENYGSLIVADDFEYNVLLILFKYKAMHYDDEENESVWVDVSEIELKPEDYACLNGVYYIFDVDVKELDLDGTVLSDVFEEQVDISLRYGPSIKSEIINNPESFWREDDIWIGLVFNTRGVLQTFNPIVPIKFNIDNYQIYIGYGDKKCDRNGTIIEFNNQDDFETTLFYFAHVKNVYNEKTMLEDVEDEDETDAIVFGSSTPLRSDTDYYSMMDDFSTMDELNDLVGLSKIKEEVNNLISFTKMQIEREKQGLHAVPVSLHLVFSGNPGTGKTTVARILAKLYKEIGVLSSGHLVEVDRSGLVAGYVGQTAIKTQEKIEEALGGVLFIDEAYTLAKGGDNDYGQEAIDTLLKAMEDNRKDLVVIVAGYTDEMKVFIDSNPGLRSRFNKYIEFEDYSIEELCQIFIGMCSKYDYVVDEEALEVVREKITGMVENKNKNFANARDVRNYFENIITKQSTRVASLGTSDANEMSLIKVEDV